MLPVATIFLIGVSTGLGTIEQKLVVTWLIGVVLILTIPSEHDPKCNPLTFDLSGWPMDSPLEERVRLRNFANRKRTARPNMNIFLNLHTTLFRGVRR